MPPDPTAFEYKEIILNHDRPRGILSKRDRQFLLEASYRDELAEQSRRNVRSRIRERLRHTILDFFLLAEHLDTRDLDHVFAEYDNAFNEGLHGLFAMMYRAADEDAETIQSWFEGGLTHIQLAHDASLLVESPTVNIDITPGQSVDTDAAVEKLETGHLEDLTHAEMQYLLWKLGKTLGGTDSEIPLSRGLAEYARRFEEQTGLDDAFELIEETNTEE